ncbi:MAG: leucine-rich repeat protein [Odoribacteraceae bacterium]|jgi:hypothetical protein|nr:leucine-rich repeat protein [Odoribacteraceae bacterium]
MKTITQSRGLVILAACFMLAACSEDDKKTVIPVTEITVAGASGSDLTLKENQTLRVTAVALPENASYRRVLFESSDETIFTVTQAGVITGVAHGVATLRAFAADGSGTNIEIPVDVDYREGITNVKTPGSLAQLTASLTSTELVVVGTLNAEDMKTITSLATTKSLTKIDLSGVTSIPDNSLKGHGATGVGLFEGAAKLESVTAPGTITAIGANCFQNAPALATVTLPATVTSVGQQAFKGCANLTSIFLDATAPPTVAANAFEGLTLKNIALTVPTASGSAYRERDVWKEMTVNGASPEVSEAYTIPAASAVEGWQYATLSTPLYTTSEWTITAVSTQASTDINTVTFGSAGWGVHLLNIVYTGTVVESLGSKPFEFYLGGKSQGSTKVGAIGRGNWNSTTHTMTPYAITLNKPVTITLTCTGNGSISMTVQNEGVNGGEPIDFKTATGVETVTQVGAAHAATTSVYVKRR